MNEPRPVNPFSFGSVTGPIVDFSPKITTVVEPGKAEAPSIGSVEPHAQASLQTVEPTPTLPTPGSQTPQEGGKQESSSVTDVQSETNVSPTENQKDSTTESGVDETNTTDKDQEQKVPASPTPIDSIPSPTPPAVPQKKNDK